MPVHIDERGRAAQQHLGDSEPRPKVDILPVELRLERPYLFGEPRHQRHIVGIASHQAHRNMVVQVDEARHRHLAAAVDLAQRCPATGTECRRLLRIGTGKSDPAIGNTDVPGEIFVCIGLRSGHRQHRATGNQYIHNDRISAVRSVAGSLSKITIFQDSVQFRNAPPKHKIRHA